jgi:hypothetical protein
VRDADADQKMRPQRLMDLMIYVGVGQGQQSPVVGPSPSRHGVAAAARVRADAVRDDSEGRELRRSAFQVCCRWRRDGKECRGCLYVIGVRDWIGRGDDVIGGGDRARQGRSERASEHGTWPGKSSGPGFSHVGRSGRERRFFARQVTILLLIF